MSNPHMDLGKGMDLGKLLIDEEYRTYDEQQFMWDQQRQKYYKLPPPPPPPDQTVEEALKNLSQEISKPGANLLKIHRRPDPDDPNVFWIDLYYLSEGMLTRDSIRFRVNEQEPFPSKRVRRPATKKEEQLAVDMHNVTLRFRNDQGEVMIGDET